MLIRPFDQAQVWEAGEPRPDPRVYGALWVERGKLVRGTSRWFLFLLVSTESTSRWQKELLACRILYAPQVQVGKVDISETAGPRQFAMMDTEDIKKNWRPAVTGDTPFAVIRTCQSLYETREQELQAQQEEVRQAQIPPTGAGAPQQKPLFRTTIIIWSEYDPGSAFGSDAMTEIVRQADDGDAYCSSIRTVRMEHPEHDPTWSSGAAEFFANEDR